VVESEDLVNCPNWPALEFRVAEQGLVRCANRKLLSYRRNSICGAACCEEHQLRGRRDGAVTLKERRLMSMSGMHLAHWNWR